MTPSHLNNNSAQQQHALAPQKCAPTVLLLFPSSLLSSIHPSMTWHAIHYDDSTTTTPQQQQQHVLEVNKCALTATPLDGHQWPKPPSPPVIVVPCISKPGSMGTEA